MLKNREEAGRRLAGRLGASCEDKTALILALPRGGVAVGYAISLAVHLPLDVFITRKLGAPGNPEFAIGAVTETGSVFLNPQARRIVAALGAPPEYLSTVIREQQEEISRRQALYRNGKPLPLLTGRTVLLVEDGVATGASFLASVEALRRLGLKQLVGVIPVGPDDTIRAIRQEVDDLVVLETHDPFFAVGNHYADFTQVDDANVIQYLVNAAVALREESRA